MLRTLLVLLVMPSVVLAQAPAPPALPDGTDAGRKQMAGFRLPKGLKVELFAAEPKLGSPVAIGLDEKGRIFAAEEYRFNAGTEENRTRPFFLEDDLQIRTLDDRLAMYKKWANKFDGGMNWFSKHGDQVRLLEDTDGDGKADKSTVFAGGFNAPLDGLAAGVMATNGDVYFTCIPNLWRLRDTNGDGVADKKEALLTGFGVCCAFLGHDLHGLCWGPDGKLYFSVGDRGFHVATKEGTTLSGPRMGAVFRCDPDGKNLEVVMRGLRNPQELAFDQYGNLFADDNNCDKGDHARLVYVVEDGDAGWNMAYQTIPQPYMAGPWFAERLWHLQHPGQAAYIVPPVGKLGSGPSGFLFTSGTSLPDRYKNSFLMCNYTGNGGLESFKVKSKGAGFEVDDYHDFLKPISATDAEFGYDGKLYVSDFVGLDWTGKSKGGRIYTVFDADKIASTDALETKKLFADGFGKLDNKTLGELLGHADQRVRLRAQFELAERDAAGVRTLTSIATPKGATIPRIHAIWGLIQAGRKYPNLDTNAAWGLLKDSDAEVRAQAAKAMGEMQFSMALNDLTRLLADPSSRVKFFAAQSLGKLKHKPAIPALFEVLAANKDADPFLRHACVAALAKIGDAEAVNAKATDPSSAVRMGVVLVQRRLGDKRLSQFLTDADPLVRTEAARAIHDLPILSEYPALAKLLPGLGLSPAADLDPLARRAISAAYQLGTTENAKAVLDAATNKNFSAAVRAEAVSALRDWADPPQRDRVTGFWRPLAKRDPAVIRTVVEDGLPKLLASASGGMMADVVGLVGKLKLKADAATFVSWVNDSKKDTSARVAALRLLADRKDAGVGDAILAGLRDPSPALRAEARDAFAALDPSNGSVLLSATVNSPASVLEKQRAIEALARLKSPSATASLDELAGKLTAGSLPPELRLDVWDALKAAPTPSRDALRAKFESTLPPGRQGPFVVSLTGGDAERGREIFFNHTGAQCVRCHLVNGAGGNAGPDLSKLMTRVTEKPREYILDSLLNPNAKIAVGFASVTITTVDGAVIAGTLLAEDKKSVTLQTPEGKKVTIPVDDIEKRTAPVSPMPTIERTLTPREVRDVVEFLSTLK